MNFLSFVVIFYIVGTFIDGLGGFSGIFSFLGTLALSLLGLWFFLTILKGNEKGFGKLLVAAGVLYIAFGPVAYVALSSVLLLTFSAVVTLVLNIFLKNSKNPALNELSFTISYYQRMVWDFTRKFCAAPKQVCSAALS